MVIDGKQLAEKILEELSTRVHNLKKNQNIIPHLAVIRVGDDPATTSYVNQKKRMGEKIGAVVSIYNFAKNVSEQKLLEIINFLQKEGEIHGLIVQLPLPGQLNEELLINSVDVDKDVDGFRQDSDFNEPIAEAILRILREIFDIENAKRPKDRTELKKEVSSKYKVLSEKNLDTKYLIHNTSLKTEVKRLENDLIFWLKTQNIVVMGKGKTGGRPILNILKKLGIEATIVDSKTQNREEITREADILVCAVGKGKVITDAQIKKDAILLGIGMHMGEDGKLHGDYDVEEIKDKAAYYTPIPGGVGPVNAAMLLVNVVNAAEQTTS